MANPVFSWAQDNPVMAGAAAIGVIVVAMLLFGGGGGSAESENSGNGAGIGAYYAAVANQAQAGAAVQMSQIEQQGETNRTLIGATYGLERDKVWAPVAQAGAASAAANTSKQLDYEYNFATQQLASTERMHGNEINLANSSLAVQQNIAFKQANVQKSNATKGLIGSIIGSAASIATGGISSSITGLLGKSGAIKGQPTGGVWV